MKLMIVAGAVCAGLLVGLGFWVLLEYEWRKPR